MPYLQRNPKRNLQHHPRRYSQRHPQRYPLPHGGSAVTAQSKHGDSAVKGYPRWFVPALVGLLALMLASGLLLAPTTVALRTDWPVPWRLSGAGRLLCAALHAAAGFALLLLTGALWGLHMRSGWRRRQQRASGLSLGLLMLLLAATAVAIYYAGDERTGAVAALLHLGLGVALVVPFGWHWWHGRRAALTRALLAAMEGAK